jgi:hypothetical protein
MATKKAGQSLAKARAKVKPVPERKPVALTVKVDNKTYVRLCTLGATQRRTNQDILQEAVREYLDRVGA